MPIIVPDSIELEVITDILTPNLTIKLYSNDETPDHESTTAGFTEVIGGGYTSFPLVFSEWNITPGDPTIAVYDSTITWTFTAPTDPPGSIYGYFVTRNSDGELVWAERFPPVLVPFAPIAGSIIKVLPRFAVQSQF